MSVTFIEKLSLESCSVLRVLGPQAVYCSPSFNFLLHNCRCYNLLHAVFSNIKWDIYVNTTDNVLAKSLLLNLLLADK